MVWSVPEGEMDRGGLSVRPSVLIALVGEASLWAPHNLHSELSNVSNSKRVGRSVEGPKEGPRKEIPEIKDAIRSSPQLTRQTRQERPKQSPLAP